MTADVRLATLADARGIAETHVRGWQQAYRDILPAPFLDSLSVERREAQWLEILAQDDRTGVANWVAERDGAIVGFASVGPARDEDTPGAGELYALYVLAEEWGTGTGPRLHSMAIEHLRARPCAEATLWVLRDNARARRFYEREGWVADGTTKDDDRGTFVLHEVRYRTEFA